MEVIKLQHPAVCAGCGREIPVGGDARYYAAGKVYHVNKAACDRASTVPPRVAEAAGEPPGEPFTEVDIAGAMLTFAAAVNKAAVELMAVLKRIQGVR